MRQVTIYTTNKEYDHFVELAKNLSYVSSRRLIKSALTKDSVQL